MSSSELTEQEHRLAAYGTVLAGLARDDSVIRRVGWVERTVPNDGEDIAAYLQQARDPALALWSGPVGSYIELIESAADVTQDHELFVSLQLPTPAVPALHRHRPNRPRQWLVAAVTSRNNSAEVVP
jgi:hypothetical protein